LIVTALTGPGLAARLAVPSVIGLRSTATLTIAIAEFACFAVAARLLRLRQPGPAVLPLFGVVLAEALRAHPEGMIPVAGAALTLCHVLPALLWAGMLLYVLRAAIAWRTDPAAMQGLIRLYANVVAWLLAVVIATGIVSALLLVPVSSLLTSTYGRFLIAKAALVATAICLAIAGRVWLRKLPPGGSGPARVTRLEGAALAAAILLTGILTVLTPPAKPVYSASARSASHSAARARHNLHSWRSPSTSTS
jgi:copper transport protein